MTPGTQLYTPLSQRNGTSRPSFGGGSLEEIKNGISHVESGGNYGAIGKPNSKGQRAYGKYQVFETNIPEWTKEALGKSLSNEEFLQDQEAQEKVADHFLGASLAQYGNPDDVASTWFTGRPVAKAGLDVADYTGTSNGDYLAKFHEGMGKSKSLYVPLAQRAGNLVAKGKEDFGNYVQGVLHPPNTEYLPIPDEKAQMTRAVPTLPIDPTGMAGVEKKAVGEAAEPIFQGFKDLSTKLLEKLKGRDVVSKQFISDLTNSPDLKQAEKDLIRNQLADHGDKVSVADFANRVKSELLPLKRITHDDMQSVGYEGTTLPDELRGPVYGYSEHVYQSPIRTSAGSVHPGLPQSESYFAHSRVEDLPAERPGMKGNNDMGAYEHESLPTEDYSMGKTRRVIELQSDLFQKGRLENEGGTLNLAEEAALRGEKTINIDGVERSNFYDHSLEQANKKIARQKELAPLEPYRNTWHERVIREEVKQAAKDGKTKLQFPTGETAMKIEGIGQGANSQWYSTRQIGADKYDLTAGTLDANKLKVGQVVSQGGRDPWIITDVLGDGKFKALPENRFLSESNLSQLKKNGDTRELAEVNGKKYFPGAQETFDISGKVDTTHGVYRRYEKLIGPYLKSKYGGKVITDPQGVKWVEIDIKPEMKKLPIEAFGVGGLGIGAASYQQNESTPQVIDS